MNISLWTLDLILCLFHGQKSLLTLMGSGKAMNTLSINPDNALVTLTGHAQTPHKPRETIP